ncbi:hypothetical protein F5146DRAFT_1000772 [Armillaria mellea]|nr:hypothetical protein F5146DRAFT_1000772 [Armillaria mellea]
MSCAMPPQTATAALYLWGPGCLRVGIPTSIMNPSLKRLPIFLISTRQDGEIYITLTNDRCPYVYSQGLLVGIYIDAGYSDTATFTEWGIDFLDSESDLNAYFGDEAGHRCQSANTGYCLNTGYAECSVLAYIRKMREIAQVQMPFTFDRHGHARSCQVIDLARLSQQQAEYSEKQGRDCGKSGFAWESGGLNQGTKSRECDEFGVQGLWTGEAWSSNGSILVKDAWDSQLLRCQSRNTGVPAFSAHLHSRAQPYLFREPFSEREHWMDDRT